MLQEALSGEDGNDEEEEVHKQLDSVASKINKSKRSSDNCIHKLEDDKLPDMSVVFW